MKISSHIVSFFKKYNLRYKEISVNSLQYYFSDEEVIYILFSKNKIKFFLIDAFGETPKEGEIFFDEDNNYSTMEIVKILYLHLRKFLSSSPIFDLVSWLAIEEKLPLQKNTVLKILHSRLKSKINNLLSQI